MAIDLLERIKDFTHVDGYLVNLNLRNYEIVHNPKVQFRALQSILYRLNLQKYQEFSVIFRDTDQVVAALRNIQNKEEFGYSAGLFFRSPNFLLNTFLREFSQNLLQKFLTFQRRRWKNISVYQGKIENNIFIPDKYNIWHINFEDNTSNFLYSSYRNIIENISFEIIPIK